MSKQKRSRYGTGCVYARKKKDGTRQWWMKFYQDGEPIVRNCHTTDRQEAERQLAIAIGEKEKGVRLERRVLMLAKALENVENANAADGKVSNLKAHARLTAFFGGRTPMAQIRTPKIRTYIKKRKDESAANGTINRELAALSRAFTQAMEDDVLAMRPHIPRLKENNARVGFFTADEYKRLLATNALTKAPHVRDAVITLHETGWRLYKEVLALRWRHVDLKVGEVRLDPDTTKNRDARVVGMTTELRQAFERRWEAREKRLKRKRVVALKDVDAGDEFVFVKRTGTRLGSFRKRWNRAIKEAKIPDRIKRLPDGTEIRQKPIPHDFRRTVVRNLDAIGISREVAKKVTGHKTDAVYNRYRIVAADEIHAVAQRVDAARRN